MNRDAWPAVSLACLSQNLAFFIDFTIHLLLGQVWKRLYCRMLLCACVISHACFMFMCLLFPEIWPTWQAGNHSFFPFVPRSLIWPLSPHNQARSHHCECTVNISWQVKCCFIYESMHNKGTSNLSHNQCWNQWRKVVLGIVWFPNTQRFSCDKSQNPYPL